MKAMPLRMFGELSEYLGEHLLLGYLRKLLEAMPLIDVLTLFDSKVLCDILTLKRLRRPLHEKNKHDE